MKPRFLRTIGLAAVALAAGASCDDPAGPPDPVPGHVELRLVTPTGAEGALLLALTGPSLPAPAAVEGAAGSMVFARAVADSGGSLKVAVFGELGNGVVARFPVPDISTAGAYTASLVEVAAPDHALRESLEGYTVTLTAAATP